MLKKCRKLISEFINFFTLCRNGLSKQASIPTHLTSQEKYQLFTLASSVAGGTACEIGSFVGASTCFIAAGLKTGKLLCVDTWGNDAMSEGSRDTWAEFAANTAPYASAIVPVRGYSTKVVEQIAGILGETKLDLLFIDGDHSYEGVKADWDLYRPFLTEGSLVVFHDWGWAEGVKKLIAEEVVPLTVNQQFLPNMWWARAGVHFSPLRQQ